MWFSQWFSHKIFHLRVDECAGLPFLWRKSPCLIKVLFRSNADRSRKTYKLDQHTTVKLPLGIRLKPLIPMHLSNELFLILVC